MRHTFHWIKAASAAAALAGCLAGHASQAAAPAATPSPYLSARPGDVFQVSIGQLRPTQAVVGYDQIYAQLGRKQPDFTRYAPTAAGYLGDDDTDNYSRYLFRTEFERVDDYCADMGQTGADPAAYTPRTVRLIDPSTYRCTGPAPAAGSAAAGSLKTVVIGPQGALYLTDGHHTFTTLNELADGGPKLPVWVRVVANYSATRDTADFWKRMTSAGYAWLRDANGKGIAPSALPPRVALAAFQDDRYRSLVYLARDLGYDNAKVSEFAEFYWGHWLRNNGIDLAEYNLRNLARSRIAVTNGTAVPRTGDSTTSYPAAVRDAALRMIALNGSTLVGPGRTAAQLGKLGPPATAGAWNDKLEDDVWRSDTNSSNRYRTAGAAWYAVKYRQCGGPAATQPACWSRPAR